MGGWEVKSRVSLKRLFFYPACSDFGLNRERRGFRIIGDEQLCILCLLYVVDLTHRSPIAGYVVCLQSIRCIDTGLGRVLPQDTAKRQICRSDIVTFM